MAIVKLNVEFDGATDVERLPGRSVVSWDGSGTTSIGYYNVYHEGDTLEASADLSGSNWRIKTLRIAGDDNTTIIRDIDNGSDRRIDFLELGYNSDVELISTRARYIFGWDGDEHRVTLGDEQGESTYSINLYGARNYLTTGSAWVKAIDTGGTGTGKGDVIKIGTGGANVVQTWDRDDVVETTG